MNEYYLLLTNANRTSAGTLFTAVRLTGEGHQRVVLRDYVVRA